ncbi:phage tail protein [Vibrio olivae]|uniref:Phage tail protein n=1 Tax=Vibrio olivae TaxID=1243002 RepID=A0ABV5HR25_9VIBR
MGLAYKPDFKLTADGKDISDIIAKNLINLTLTDKAGTESDRLSIALSWPSNHKTPTKGAVLKLSIGFEGQLVDKGQFVVDEINISGPPRRLQIVANAAPMDSTKQLGSLQAHKTRSWDSVTLEDVLKTTSSEHGLIPRMSNDFSQIAIEHLDQINESDMSLMTRLARRYGAISKPMNGYWLFLKEGQQESASGKTLQNFTITREMISNWQYRDSSRNDSKRIVATYHDVKGGQTKEVSVGRGEPAFRILFKYSNYEDAEFAAVSMFHKRSKGSESLEISAPLTPDLIHLSTMCVVHCVGVGEKENRDWHVNSIKLSINEGGSDISILAGA